MPFHRYSNCTTLGLKSAEPGFEDKVNFAGHIMNFIGHKLLISDGTDGKIVTGQVDVRSKPGKDVTVGAPRWSGFPGCHLKVTPAAPTILRSQGGSKLRGCFNRKTFTKFRYWQSATLRM